ncbi:MAG: hypothetical protein IKD45_02115 [Clostridia bacterium]|nr:hypothetical protein [Clostridia bacterium]
MIEDSSLKRATDYSKGMIEAAYCVLGEIVNILAPYADDMRIIGGWVPSLLFQGEDHIGSIDVDVLLNQNDIENGEKYENIKRILLRNEYRRHPKQYFTFVKTVKIADALYDVDVDLLSGMYGGANGKESKHIDGIKALPATGGNFAFDFPAQKVKIDYKRPDGALDAGNVNVIAIIPYIVMKTAALGRGKAKDAYDIYYCINHYEGGVRKLLSEMLPYKEKELIKETCRKLSEKFASAEHAGPFDIVNFMEITDPEEKSRIKQDAYQKINYLVQGLK